MLPRHAARPLPGEDGAQRPQLDARSRGGRPKAINERSPDGVMPASIAARIEELASWSPQRSRLQGFHEVRASRTTDHGTRYVFVLSEARRRRARRRASTGPAHRRRVPRSWRTANRASTRSRRHRFTLAPQARPSGAARTVLETHRRRRSTSSSGRRRQEGPLRSSATRASAR